MMCVRLSKLVVLTVYVALFAASAQAQVPAAATPADRQDAWWQQRHEGMNARVKQGNVDLLLIGDSITHGWEGEGKDVWAKFYAKRNAVNLGIGGDRTQHVLWRLEHGNIDGISPKLAVLMIGTNNAGAGDSPENIAAGVKAIVEKLRIKLPQTKVLVLAIFPRGANNQDGLRQINTKANEIISKLADEQNVFFLDIGPKFLAADGSLSNETMPDLLHLTPKSYEIWAEAIEPTVAKLMGETDAQGSIAVNPVARPDDWWQQRHAAMNERVKQGNVDMILIGDSITHGWEGGADVWNKFYGKRNAVNLGISGDQTAHVLWRLDHGNIDGISPKLAVIMIGTNNAGHEPHQPPEEIAKGVKAIVDKLRTKLPQTKVLVLAIFPRGADNNDPLRQINTKANEIISKLADGQNVFFLDIGPKFLAADGTLSKDVMPDLLHLNGNSYNTWAESIEPMVKQLMGEK